jgi:hypothetical protein
MDGFSEDERVVVVGVSCALRLEAVPNNRTIRILGIFIPVPASLLAEVGLILFPEDHLNL